MDFARSDAEPDPPVSGRERMRPLRKSHGDYSRQLGSEVLAHLPRHQAEVLGEARLEGQLLQAERPQDVNVGIPHLLHRHERLRPVRDVALKREGWVPMLPL